MMARNYRRRGSSSSEKFYRTLDNRLPVRFSFTTVTAAIIIVFITFVMACFTAAICGSSQEKSENSMEKASYCTAHYDAETTATEILSILSADNGSSLTDKNGELKYDSAGGEITISRNGGNFSFDVPITKKETLHVIAQITEGNVDIISWCVRN